MNTAASITVALVEGSLGAPTSRRADNSSGAWVVFEGVVREDEGGRSVSALRYTAYEPMAQNMLAEIAASVQNKHGLAVVFVEHSRGLVPVGQCSFRLAIGAPHRKEALAAMDEFIDRMKKDVPIWKAPDWA